MLNGKEPRLHKVGAQRLPVRALGIYTLVVMDEGFGGALDAKVLLWRGVERNDVLRHLELLVPLVCSGQISICIAAMPINGYAHC